MTKVLNTYQRVLSPKGQMVTLFTDNGLFTTNPWKEIRAKGLTRRYRKGNNSWEIEKLDKSGWTPIIDESDYDYWTNYINQLEESAKNVPADNIFQYTKKWITGNLDKQKLGGTINYSKFFK